VEDQDKRIEEETEDVEAHKKRHASEEPSDESEKDADFELHKKRL
jgi:hypothetical protein